MGEKLNRTKKRKKIFNITLIGPQGSGKGTQAQLLAKKFNFAIIEIGGSLREIAKEKTPLGQKINEIINQKGRMVPVPLVMRVVREKIKAVSPDQGIVFDGTPRRLAEIKPLNQILKRYRRRLTHIFFIEISKDEVIKRLSKRRVCQKCQSLFILGQTISSQTKKCPKCGGEIYQRPDDRPAAIEERLKLYQKKTEPVLKYYQKRGQLIRINGEQPIKKVFKDIVSYL